MNALEVLYMQLVNNKEARKINNYGMWRDVYSTDPNDILNSLLKKKVIFEDTRKETLYSQLKVSELKELLRQNSLKLSGRKSELIERLIDNNVDVGTENYLISPIYAISDEYLELANKTEFILFFHNRYFIDIFDAYDYYLKHQELSNHDLIINIMNMNIKKALSSNEYIEAMRMHSDLAKYFADRNDAPSAQYHIHNQQMLNLINDYERMLDYSSYGIVVDSESDSYLFHISDWVLLQYKSILKTRQMSEKSLTNEILNSTDHLPFKREIRKLFANFIIESIYNDSDSKKKLMFNIKNSTEFKKSESNAELATKIESNIKAPSQSKPTQSTKSGCLGLFLLPGFSLIYIIDKIINIF